MTVNNWELLYSDNFLEELAAIQQYVSQFSSVRARKLTSGIMSFTVNKIPLNPHAYVEYTIMKTPDAIYRRALYKHDYAIVYKIQMDSLLFLDVYHTSRNKDV
ncbi:type II toxin-antitoxin system RelE/ParE family toxin [Spirosoma montaniterrae]|uniref:Plasmid stabilization protein n=1 Tax=Spirosoma montaniterrae TaxID=1178516 RepID=A0A1P9WX52_9BACT|nr:type II toxin-antitoxin system RelE/ParE family toxin [Spirosoma montaniterrae]AQG79964.1 hypothetical protein AWR27_11885 [Spirosoma montaniterrae]